MNQSVTRASFYDAILTGDLPSIHAYFAQPHVQEEVQDTNAYITETSPTDASNFTLAGGKLPWFRRPKIWPTDATDLLLRNAGRDGYTDVIAWFFSREAVAILGSETMVLLLPVVAQFSSARMGYERPYTCDPRVLETLLTSYVFCDVITDDHEKQRILDDVVGSSPSSDVISIAIAHGACVNAALPRIAQASRRTCVAMLEAAGAFLVGAKVFESPFGYWDYRHTESILTSYGVDWRGAEGLFIDALWRKDNLVVVEALQSCGFLDVDARDDDGWTALMHVAKANPTTDDHCYSVESRWDDDGDLIHDYTDMTPDLAKVLLKFSDANVTDDSGCTALHYATEQNPGVGVILLSNGADPTTRNHSGLAPLDLIDVDSLKSVELLEQLLEAGADPYNVPPGHSPHEDSVEAAIDRQSQASDGTNDRRSLFSRLSASECGWEFIRTHARYFYNQCHASS